MDAWSKPESRPETPRGTTVPQPKSLLDPEVKNDPYPFYRWLRSTAPVYWDEPMQAWVVSRYDDVMALAHDPRVSSVPPRDPDRAPRRELLETLNGNFVMGTDQPTHRRLRRLMEKALVPLVERTPPRITQVTEELLDAVLPSGRMEVMRDLAVPLTITVQSEFIGLPPSDGAQVTQWQFGLAGFMTTTAFVSATEESDRQALQSLEALTKYLRAALGGAAQPAVRGRRSAGALVRVGQESDGLTPDEAPDQRHFPDWGELPGDPRGPGQLCLGPGTPPRPISKAA